MKINKFSLLLFICSLIISSLLLSSTKTQSVEDEVQSEVEKSTQMTVNENGVTLPVDDTSTVPTNQLDKHKETMRQQQQGLKINMRIMKMTAKMTKRITSKRIP